MYMIILLATVVMALVLFYLIVFQLDIPGMWKFGLVVVEMILVNQVLIKKYKFSSEIGLVLLKSKQGIEAIEKLARNERVLNFIADLGSAIAYGALSLRLMKKNVSLPHVVFGLIVLVLMCVYVAPFALGFLLYVIGIGGAGKAGSGTISTLAGSMDIGLIIVGTILLIGGIFLLMLFGIVYYGLVIFKALVTTIFFGTNAIAATSPGGDVLLPGINLPFFEGIIALAVVMVVHEGAHAVLARIAKVPILSSGLVLFGIIPIGAFVEPDEKRLARVEAGRQTRVLVAGPAANILVSGLLFILFMGLFIPTSSLREGALYVYYNDSSNHTANYTTGSSMANHTTRVLPQGTLLYEIDGIPIDSINVNASTSNSSNYSNSSGNNPRNSSTIYKLAPNQTVVLLTNKGEVIKQADENGKLGLEGYLLSRDYIFSRYRFPPFQFLYIVLGLSIALNFVVGTVNILPIPLFDGYKIIDVNVKNKMIVNILSYATLAFFILNFLPRFFQ